ncbi:MAG: hypothetical protein ACREO3_04095, partial [Arenimonas sp.]
AWGALGHALREAAFELSDARVTEAKCAWWAEELAGWGEGRSRHPLGRVLSRSEAPWSRLGQACLALAEAEPAQPDTAAAIGALMDPARALAVVESALFTPAQPDPDPDRAARAIAVHWLAQRVPAGVATDDRGRIPLHLVARHGNAAFAEPGPARVALLRDWGAELLAAGGPDPAGPLFRRARSAFDRSRLQQLARTGEAGAAFPPATLWRAWHAARTMP